MKTRPMKTRSMKTRSMKTRPMKTVLEEALTRGLWRLDLRARVAASLPKLGLKSHRRPSRVRVIAIGKAAPAMGQGAIDRWGRRSIQELLIVTTDETPVPRSLERYVRRAGHPIPDQRSVASAEEALAMAARSSEDRIPLLVLISGGASALVCAPKEGITLEQKQAITERLLTSEATIQRINQTRKRLSRIKGGRLALAAAPAKVSTRIASDVIDGRPSDVGSGPSVIGDVSTNAKTDTKIDAKIVASPEELAAVVAKELRARGFSPVDVLPPSQRPLLRLAREYERRARSLAPGQAIVRAAEPSLVVTHRSGSGGRSTHLATVVARALAKLTRKDVTFMAASTDGVDGSSETAGAIVDGTTFETISDERIDRALETFNTGALLRRIGAARPKKPSGQNLADLHVLLCPRRSRAPSRARRDPRG